MVGQYIVHPTVFGLHISYNQKQSRITINAFIVSRLMSRAGFLLGILH